MKRRHASLDSTRILQALLCSTSMTLALSSFAPVHAQSAAQTAQSSTQTAQAAPVIEEVVVTARRREEKIQDIPLDVSAFSGERLQDLAITSAETLNRLDPGLKLDMRAGNRAQMTPFIRGQGSAQTSAAGVQQSVISYFAEAPIALLTPLTFYDLSSIQVLKGPQGTLFGATATGGSVLFTPTKPDGKTGGYVNIEAGNYAYKAVEGAVDIPVIEDKWFTRFAGQIRKRNGFDTIYESHPGAWSTDGDNIDFASVRFSSVLRPTDSLEIYTIFQTVDTRTNGNAATLLDIYDRNPSFRETIPANSAQQTAQFIYFSGYPPTPGLSIYQMELLALAKARLAGPRAAYINTDQTGATRSLQLINTITENITDNIVLKDVAAATQLKSRGGYNSPDGNDLSVLDQTPLACVQGWSPKDCMLTSSIAWSNEFQIQGTFLNGALTLQTGFFIERTPFGGDWGTGGTNPGNGILTGSSNSTAAACAVFGVTNQPCVDIAKNATQNYAPYIQGTYAITDAVHLTAGFRKTWNDIAQIHTAGRALTTNFMGFNIAVPVMRGDPLFGATQIRTDQPTVSGTSYTFAVDWKVTADTLLYLTHRKGYKSGGFNTNPLVPVDAQVYQPESVKDVEGGVKTDLRLGDTLIRANVAGYYMDYSNIQRQTNAIGTNNAYVSYLGNVANATIYGVDANLNIVPSPYFDVNLGIAYNHTGFDQWSDQTTCQSQPYRAGCPQTPGTTAAQRSAIPVFVNHVTGVVRSGAGATATSGGVVEQFGPDFFADAPVWSIKAQPALNLGFVSERMKDMRLSANIQYQSRYVSRDVNLTSGTSYEDQVTPAFATLDLRFDWKNFGQVGGATLNLYVAATNLFDIVEPIMKFERTGNDNTVTVEYNEPRMIFAGVRASF